MKKRVLLFLGIFLAGVVVAQTDSSTQVPVKTKSGKNTEAMPVSDSKPDTGSASAKASTQENVKSETKSGVEQEETGELVAEDTVIQISDSARATLKVLSEPDGATIVFDGATVGKTPFEVTDIIAGKHVLLLKKKGYFGKKATVKIAAGSHNELTFELVQPVQIAIISEPAGATIIMNNNTIGKTPYVDSTLKPDTYNITLGLEGYHKAQHTVTLGSGERDSMIVALKPLDAKPAASDATPDKEAKSPEKERKVGSILDKIALAVFLGFSLIILLVELTQDK